MSNRTQSSQLIQFFVRTIYILSLIQFFFFFLFICLFLLFWWGILFIFFFFFFFFFFVNSFHMVGSAPALLLLNLCIRFQFSTFQPSISIYYIYINISNSLCVSSMVFVPGSFLIDLVFVLLLLSLCFFFLPLLLYLLFVSLVCGQVDQQIYNFLY